MIKSLLLFFRKSFKTNLQLKLEVIFLTKQIEILQRTTPQIKTKITDRIFFSVMIKMFSNWKERIFNVKRTHLGLNKDSSEGRPVQKEGQIEKIPVVNGLRHYYYRKAA
jgi:hypothetical protein